MLVCTWLHILSHTKHNAAHTQVAEESLVWEVISSLVMGHCRDDIPKLVAPTPSCMPHTISNALEKHWQTDLIVQRPGFKDNHWQG